MCQNCVDNVTWAGTAWDVPVYAALSSSEDSLLRKRAESTDARMQIMNLRQVFVSQLTGWYWWPGADFGSESTRSFVWF